MKKLLPCLVSLLASGCTFSDSYSRIDTGSSTVTGPGQITTKNGYVNVDCNGQKVLIKGSGVIEASCDGRWATVTCNGRNIPIGPAEVTTVTCNP